MRSLFPFFHAVVAFSLLTSCGSPRQEGAETKVIREAETNQTDPAPILAFVAKTREIIAGETRAGMVPASQFIDLLPLSPEDRDELLRAFPSSFAFLCDETRCTTAIDGQRTSVTLLGSVKLSERFTITNPLLTLTEHVSMDVKAHGEDGLEVCRLNGVKVSKFGLSQPVHGLMAQVLDGQPKLMVSDAAGDYTCE